MKLKVWIDYVLVAKHVVCQCTKFQMSRNQLIQIITKQKLNMNKTDKEILIDILTSSDLDILKAVALFL